MAATTRRTFIAYSGAGILSVVGRRLHASPLGLPIGSQTYPHRQRIKDGDFAGLCRDMAALGIGSIELCSPGYGEFAALTDGKQTEKDHRGSRAQLPERPFTLDELRNGQQQVIAWATTSA